jgi:hypothetical protein
MTSYYDAFGMRHHEPEVDRLIAAQIEEGT